MLEKFLDTSSVIQQRPPKVVVEFKEAIKLKISINGGRRLEIRERVNSHSIALMLRKKYPITVNPASPIVYNNPFGELVPRILDSGKYFSTELYRKMGGGDEKYQAGDVVLIDLDYTMNPRFTSLYYAYDVNDFYEALRLIIRYNKISYQEGKLTSKNLKKIDTLMISDFHNEILSESQRETILNEIQKIITLLGNDVYPLKKIIIYHG